MDSAIFTSHVHRTMDDKGRLILPGPFRDTVYAGSPDGELVLTVFRNIVIGITPDHWEKIKTSLLSSKSNDKRLYNTKKKFFSNLVPLKMNKQGRIAIPASFRKTWGLDGDVVLVGSGNRFEIMTLAQFNEFMGEDEDPSEALDEAGIDLDL